MYFKTHFTITIFGVLLLIGLIEHKFYFVFFAIIGTLIPDIDTRHSKWGKNRIFRPLQFFLGHRGPIHSFSFLILISILLYFWNPAISFGFFLGYGLHLIADSFTVMGIYPFWPLKRKWSWKIRTGKNVEGFLFILFVVIDSLLVFGRVFRVF